MPNLVMLSLVLSGFCMGKMVPCPCSSTPKYRDVEQGRRDSVVSLRQRGGSMCRSKQLPIRDRECNGRTRDWLAFPHALGQALRLWKARLSICGVIERLRGALKFSAESESVCCMKHGREARNARGW